MRVLGLDTSTPACQVAVVDIATGRTLATRSVVDARRAGEVLAPSIEAALSEANLRHADLGAVAVGLGPGPYTGLRIGIVTAAALGDALGVPVYGVCSLDALVRAPAGPPPAPAGVAAPPDAPAPAGSVAVATDARRREVYWATYGSGGRVHGPSVGRPADVADELRALGVTTLVGDGAMLYAAAFDGLFDPAGPRYPDPAGIVGLVADRALGGAPGDPLTPLYLRRPDAAAPHPAKAVAAGSGHA